MCGEKGPCSEHVCQFGSTCVEKSGQAYCECPVCPAEFAPVCGSDGISYGNECKLRLEGCKHRRDIRVLYDGPCSKWNLFLFPSRYCLSTTDVIRVNIFVPVLKTNSFIQLLLLYSSYEFFILVTSEWWSTVWEFYIVSEKIWRVGKILILFKSFPINAFNEWFCSCNSMKILQSSLWTS